MEVQNIKPLVGKFGMAAYSSTVHLTNLAPTGGVQAWTRVACEKLQEVMEKAGMEVDIEVVGEVVEDSWPVVMFVKEKDTSSEPLEVEEFSFNSVGQILRDEGLALLLRTGSGTVMCDLDNCAGDGIGITEAGLEVIKAELC